MVDAPRSSLTGISPELRIRVYRYLFDNIIANALQPVTFTLSTMPIGRVTPSRRPQFRKGHVTSGDFAITVTCRMLHEEAAQYVWSKVELHLFISRNIQFNFFDYHLSLGLLKDITFMPFIRELGIRIKLDKSSNAKKVLSQRIEDVTRAIQGGRFLKKLIAVIQTDADDTLYSWYPELLEKLKTLRVCGIVQAYIQERDGTKDYGNKHCKELVRIVTV